MRVHTFVDKVARRVKTFGPMGDTFEVRNSFVGVFVSPYSQICSVFLDFVGHDVEFLG